MSQARRFAVTFSDGDIMFYTLDTRALDVTDAGVLRVFDTSKNTNTFVAAFAPGYWQSIEEAVE